MENSDVINKKQIDELVYLINKYYGKKCFAQQIRRFMQISLYHYLRADDTNIDADDMAKSWYTLTELVEIIDPVLEK